MTALQMIGVKIGNWRMQLIGSAHLLGVTMLMRVFQHGDVGLFNRVWFSFLSRLKKPHLS